jgi:hypothetical protein
LKSWGSFTCYSDGSRQGGHIGYGYVIKKYKSIAWVKAHAQHQGNEQADKLAKLGAGQRIGPARFQYYKSSASFSHSLLEKINQLWQQRWDLQPPEKYIHSKVFIQSIHDTKNKLDNVLRTRNRVCVGKYAQFITGHGYFNYHLNKSNPFIEQNCRKCLNGPETPEHLLVTCEAYTNHRRDAFDGLDVLNPGFGWTVDQIRRFLMNSDLWSLMEYLD